LGRFKNKHAGQRCFVIGNGPSLTIADLEKLNSEVTFASNKIYLLFDQTAWLPRYYVLEDEHVIRQNHEQIRRLRGFTKFVHYEWKSSFQRDPTAIWYPWRFLNGSDFPKFSDDPLKVVYCGYMVTYIILQLAYFMGFETVYLVGMDFSYSRVYEGAGAISSGEPEQEHFAPGYYKPGETRFLPRLDLAEKAMLCARNFYEANGRKILNATRGGKLEVFERINFEEALRY
jgi:hypothetical protein